MPAAVSEIQVIPDGIITKLQLRLLFNNIRLLLSLLQLK